VIVDFLGLCLLFVLDDVDVLMMWLNFCCSVEICVVRCFCFVRSSVVGLDLVDVGIVVLVDEEDVYDEEVE